MYNFLFDPFDYWCRPSVKTQVWLEILDANRDRRPSPTQKFFMVDEVDECQLENWENRDWDINS